MNNRERWTLTAAVLGSAIVFVDSTVVNVALPRIGRELPTTLFGVLEGQSYVYNGYLLTLSALLILAGALSDFYGRRRMFLVGLVGFGATSVLCGASPNMEFLVASRVLQGAAGALLVPGSLPILTARSRDPLVPLDLFRSRNFSVTNVSTFLIYGALYVSFYYLALFVQGVLGYSAAAAGLAGIPGGLLLAIFSTRFGALAARYGPRVFMSVGPAIMALGVLWFSRVPSTSRAWLFAPGDPSTWGPPSDYVVDFLPGQIIFGVGLAMMVAPLTTALMTSVPVRNSGVASAINNAISRVGPQLAGAAIFVAITATFYAGMAARLPGTDTSDAAFRHDYAPLNVPRTQDPKAVADREQSTDAFHLASLVGAGLLAAGALVNAVGISNHVALEAAKRRA